METIQINVRKDVRKQLDKVNRLFSSLVGKNLKTFCDIGAQLSSISDYWQAKLKPLKLFEVHESEQKFNLASKTDFFGWLQVVGEIPFGYSQSTKYIACFMNQNILLNAEELQKYGIEISDISDLNKAAMAAKNPEAHEAKKSGSRKEIERKIGHKISDRIEIKYFEKDGRDNVLKHVLNVLFVQFGVAGLSEESKALLTGSFAVKESVTDKIKREATKAIEAITES